MSNIEELERQKKELQLRHDIAKLERSKRIRDVASMLASWSWGWVIPCSILSLLFFKIGFVDGGGEWGLLLGPVFIAPLVLKLFNSRGD